MTQIKHGAAINELLTAHGMPGAMGNKMRVLWSFVGQYFLQRGK
ncbi:MAG: hypothetical protein BWY75_02216 [bacterium ADurb.Bin425]|nr:MAG: hypothetical protein BWY75_02216 [bacterium ADurb.Bin425]